VDFKGFRRPDDSKCLRGIFSGDNAPKGIQPRIVVEFAREAMDFRDVIPSAFNGTRHKTGVAWHVFCEFFSSIGDVVFVDYQGSAAMLFQQGVGYFTPIFKSIGFPGNDYGVRCSVGSSRINDGIRIVGRRIAINSERNALKKKEQRKKSSKWEIVNAGECENHTSQTEMYFGDSTNKKCDQGSKITENFI
jgi:hypothetical protein